MASGNRRDIWRIEREPAGAARPTIKRAVDIGPQAALGAFAQTFVVAGMRNDDARTPFLSVVDLAGTSVAERTLDKAAEVLLASPGGLHIGVMSDQGYAEVRSLPSLDAVWRPPATLAPGSQPIIAFSPDDRFLIWGRSEIGVWLVELGSGQVRSLSGPVSGLAALAVAPGGTAAAWAYAPDSDCRCFEITFWGGSAGSGTRSLGKLQSRGDGMKPSLTFDRNGLQLASGIGEGTLWIWNVARRDTPISLLQDGPLTDLAFSRDGRYLITLGTGRTVRSAEQNEVAVWHLEEGRKVWRHLTADRIAGAVMSADGRNVLLGKHTVLRDTGIWGLRWRRWLGSQRICSASPANALRIVSRRTSGPCSSLALVATVPVAEGRYGVGVHGRKSTPARHWRRQLEQRPFRRIHSLRR